MVIDSCLLAWFKSWVSHGDICMSFIDGCGKTVPEMITDRCYCCKMTISWLCVTFLQFFMLFFECHQSSVSHGSFPFPTLIYLFLGFFLCLCFFLSQDKVITHTIRCKILFWNVTLYFVLLCSVFFFLCKYWDSIFNSIWYTTGKKGRNEVQYCICDNLNNNISPPFPCKNKLWVTSFPATSPYVNSAAILH